MKEHFPFQSSENKKEMDTAQKRSIDRRAFLRKALFAAGGLAMSGMLFEHLYNKSKSDSNNESIKKERFPIERWSELKKIKPELPLYEKKYSPVITNLDLTGKEGRYGVDTLDGKIIRTLRWKNITDAVETRYNLPPLVLLAMIMEESTGVDLLANGMKVAREDQKTKKKSYVYEGGDGGFGLIHMQGATAHEYNLHTYEDCDAMVCNGVDKRSCKDEHGKLVSHAKELYEKIQSNQYSRAELMVLDDRLHPIYNIDAAGRMIASYIAKGKGKHSLDEYELALARYAGATNFKQYFNDIEKNRFLLSDKDTIEQAERTFNSHNVSLQIDGEPALFNDYISVMHRKNEENFGLSAYKELPYLLPENTDVVIANYSDTSESRSI
jgi:hypothetical protein